ncbi:hypothetical protein ACEUAZ_01350 [Aeromonas veronii]
MLCFHTCKTDGGKEFVSESAPFLSGKNIPRKWQWLSQGYYFWTDDPHFAHIWGECSYNDDYAILKCKLSFQPDMLLDLAGNVAHSLYFQKLVSIYVKKLQGKDPTIRPTVSTVIEHFRKEKQSTPMIFPYQAIKAVDIPSGGYRKKLRFTPKSNECLPLLPRIQLCLFEEARDIISDKEIIYFS